MFQETVSVAFRFGHLRSVAGLFCKVRTQLKFALSLVVLVGVCGHAQAQLDAGRSIYTVRAGDTLFGIARDIGAKPEDIVRENGLTNSNVIYVGQQLSVARALAGGVSPATLGSNAQQVGVSPLPSNTLPIGTPNGAFDPYSVDGLPPAIASVPLRQNGQGFVPQPLQPQVLQPRLPQPQVRASQPLSTLPTAVGAVSSGSKVMHVVRPGETLGMIAQRYNVPARLIVNENRLAVPIQLYVDQALFIPGVGGFASNANASSLAQRSGNISNGGFDFSQVSPSAIQPTTPAASIPTLNQNTTEVAAANVTSATVTSPEAPKPPFTALPPKPKAKPKRVAAVVKTTPSAPKTNILASNNATASESPKPAAQPKAPVVAANTSSDSLLSDPPPDRATRFQWPVRGRVLSSFGTKTDGRLNDGINISVATGSSVKAADDGVVAYSGDALKDFGKLLLVRHSDGWITAYAHNSELRVKKGDSVSRGQVIALSGQTGNASEPQLHFEVRRGARPVDPLPYLAKN